MVVAAMTCWTGHRLPGLLLGFLIAMGVLPAGPVRAEEKQAAIELSPLSIKARDLAADGAVFNWLRQLREVDRLDLPGGVVTVTLTKGKADLAWKDKPHGPKARLAPSGKSVKIKRGRVTFKALFFTHASLGLPFVVNEIALRADLDGTTALFVDADLDGKYGTRAKDVVVLLRGELVWALPVMDTMPLGRRFGRPTIAGDPPTLTIESAPWVPAEEYRDALAVLNVQRILLGQRECVLDEAFSRACEKHCHYLALNGIKSGQGKTHGEESGLPGYSAEGALAAKNSAIGSSDLPMPEQVSGFLRSFYHRMGLIHPSTHRVGMAHADGCNMLDSVSGLSRVDGKWPQLYPVPGQFDVPLSFRSEWPNPIPDGGVTAGFPITLRFPPRSRGFSQLKASLLEGKKERAIRVAVSSPDQPSHSARSHNYDSILVLPLERLASHELYRVRLSYRLAGRDEAHDFIFYTGDRALGGTWRRR